MFKVRNNIFVEAEFIESPNSSLRPEGTEPSIIVIHNISLPPGEFGTSYIKDFFTNNLDITSHSYFQEIKDLKVSSHLLIDREGNLVQFVPFSRSAWHAGISSFKGKKNCNDFSIGIELEGADDIPYAENQYLTLHRVSKSLMESYPKISLDNIVGHSDIAPDRKSDPGNSFDWNRYKQDLS